MNSKHPKPRIAIFKFASCDGCQLSLLDAEDELLAVAGAVDIAYFPEATRKMSKGPYDIALVEGSITTHHDADKIQQVRRQAKVLVTIGACATAGGIQALRNWRDVSEYVRMVYAKPDYISTLKMSTPVAEHVPVDLELRGCPIQKAHLIEVISATLAGRKPNIPTSSVCLECKRRDNVCLMVAPRHAVPGTGHAGRLRRHLPGLRGAAATAASARWKTPTHPAWPSGCADWELASRRWSGRSAPSMRGAGSSARSARRRRRNDTDHGSDLSPRRL